MQVIWSVLSKAFFEPILGAPAARRWS